jgi:hypothetical protein
VSVPGWPAFGDSHAVLVSLAGHFKLITVSNVDVHRSPAAASGSP